MPGQVETNLENTTKPPHHISVDVIIDDFKSHLSIDDNIRIFFSAKFGTGKTYFLQEFFNVCGHEYEVIKLYPINYSTASNKDVYELIKYDILFHLIRFHEDKIDKLSISNLMKLEWFINNKLNPNEIEFSIGIVTQLTENDNIKSSLPAWTATVGTLYKIYKIAKEEYLQYLSRDLTDDLDKVDDFLCDITKNIPEYGDMDPISQIIKTTVNNIYKSGKKVVLLIDDMDRLDPDHLFRLLNVFGNHLSFSSENKISYINENKFGFQKVILVGDIKNVRSIFEHRYGKDTDFEGYFSKYFSKKVYTFDIKKIIFENDSFQQKTKLRDYYLLNINKPVSFPSGFDFNILLQLLDSFFMFFLTENQISFRHLLQKNKFSPPTIDYIGYPILRNSYIYRMSEYFITFFDTKENYLKILSNCTDFVINKKGLTGNNPHLVIFHELVIYNFNNLKVPSDIDYLNRNSHVLFDCDLESIHDNATYSFHCKINLQNEYSKIVDFNYVKKDTDLGMNIPDISFKKLYIPFVSKFF